MESLTGGFAHADLTLALHQWMEGRQSAARAASRHGGSFSREARHAGDWGRGRGRWGRGRATLRLAAKLGQGGGHALVVACGAQEVVEDLQDGADISPGTSITVLAVGVQSA